MRIESLPKQYHHYIVFDDGTIVNHELGVKVENMIDEKGNVYVVLEGTHKKTRKFLVANLVAENFIPNVNNLGYIYFKDGNKQNVNYKNIDWAINPEESRSRVKRPSRHKVEEKRHELIVKINNAIEKDNWDTAKKLGIELWELEGADWSKRNE